jgi:hypothetical protein
MLQTEQQRLLRAVRTEYEQRIPAEPATLAAPAAASPNIAETMSLTHALAATTENAASAPKTVSIVGMKVNQNGSRVASGISSVTGVASAIDVSALGGGKLGCYGIKNLDGNNNLSIMRSTASPAFGRSRRAGNARCGHALLLRGHRSQQCGRGNARFDRGHCHAYRRTSCPYGAHGYAGSGWNAHRWHAVFLRNYGL